MQGALERCGFKVEEGVNNLGLDMSPHADLASSVAFRLAPVLKKSPVAIAKEIHQAHLSRVQIRGAGGACRPLSQLLHEPEVPERCPGSGPGRQRLDRPHDGEGHCGAHLRQSRRAAARGPHPKLRHRRHSGPNTAPGRLHCGCPVLRQRHGPPGGHGGRGLRSLPAGWQQGRPRHSQGLHRRQQGDGDESRDPK